MYFRVRFNLLWALSILGIALLLVFGPIPHGAWKRYELLKVGVGAFFLISYLGKFLYDTLFYDRYWP